MQITVEFLHSDPMPPPDPMVHGWRGKHKAEGGRQGVPTGMPMVLPPIDVRALEMTRSIQLMHFDLMKHFIPSITGKQWRAKCGHAVAMNNGAQNGFDGGIPHRDYVNKWDIDPNVPVSLPRFDKMQRGFGGSLIHGEPGYSVTQTLRDVVSLMRGVATRRVRTMASFRRSYAALTANNILICKPGMHGIDARAPMPSIPEIVAQNKYIIATTCGEPDHIYYFPVDGVGQPVAYPFIFDRDISFPLEWFQKWDRDYLPDPLKIYPDIPERNVKRYMNE